MAMLFHDKGVSLLFWTWTSPFFLDGGLEPGTTIVFEGMVLEFLE
jgi:hypothetical protein